MTAQASSLSVSRSITVDVPQERAFAVFTEDMGSWWPFDGKSIGAAQTETAIVEPRAGGRWFERGVDGSECDWGRVIAYEPPERVVLDWQIGADWNHNPELSTEVEVRFIAEGQDRTRVELEHRNLEAYGEHARQMEAILGSDDGWGDVLQKFAAHARG